MSFKFYIQAKNIIPSRNNKVISTIPNSFLVPLKFGAIISVSMVFGIRDYIRLSSLIIHLAWDSLVLEYYTRW